MSARFDYVEAFNQGDDAALVERYLARAISLGPRVRHHALRVARTCCIKAAPAGQPQLDQGN
ncbi:hypothetical protein [Sphingomonas koreensis]